MKRETLTHPKTYDLAARLDCSRPTALGYLTLLWNFAADMAIAGDIGKWPDGAIARSCEYPGPPEEFVAALVDSGWIDRSECHRLVVHDWADHCERWVKLKMGKLGVQFASINGSIERSTEGSIEASAGRSPPRDRTEPNPTQPIPAGPVGVPAVRFVDVWPTARKTAQHIATLIEPDRRLRKRDRELAAKAACMVQVDALRDPVMDVAESIARKEARVEKPWAYFRRSLIRLVNEAFGDGAFDQLWKSIEIPGDLLEPNKQND